MDMNEQWETRSLFGGKRCPERQPIVRVDDIVVSHLDKSGSIGSKVRLMLAHGRAARSAIAKDVFKVLAVVGAPSLATNDLLDVIG